MCLMMLGLGGVGAADSGSTTGAVSTQESNASNGGLSTLGALGHFLGSPPVLVMSGVMVFVLAVGVVVPALGSMMSRSVIPQAPRLSSRDPR